MNDTWCGDQHMTKVVITTKTNFTTFLFARACDDAKIIASQTPQNSIFMNKNATVGVVL